MQVIRISRTAMCVLLPEHIMFAIYVIGSQMDQAVCSELLARPGYTTAVPVQASKYVQVSITAAILRCSDRNRDLLICMSSSYSLLKKLRHQNQTKLV